jgi:uncharacterized membrane protein YjgN (DUF898 family)
MNIIETSGALVPRTSIAFEGRMGAFVRLAAVNLLLMLLTLGIYRFWAKTRVRRYLWSHTRVDGDALEYRGTGAELLVGALLAVVLVIAPLFAVSMALQVVAAQGQFVLAGLLYLALVSGLFYVIGVGVYRSRRYLLSRTSWRGIRGGMEAAGWRFGLRYLGLSLLQMVTLGLATPSISVRIWNGLVNDARFGSFAFASDAVAKGLYPRFLLSLLASGIVIGGAVMLLMGVSAFAMLLTEVGPATVAGILFIYAAAFVALFAAALIMAGYQAAFMRRVFGATSLGGLRFGLDVGARDLIRFHIGNALIVALTLGLGIVVLPFRTWTFYLGRLRTEGALDADTLTQTSLQGPGQGDGIADAFDLSAI